MCTACNLIDLSQVERSLHRNFNPHSAFLGLQVDCINGCLPKLARGLGSLQRLRGDRKCVCLKTCTAWFIIQMTRSEIYITLTAFCKALEDRDNWSQLQAWYSPCVRTLNINVFRQFRADPEQYLQIKSRRSCPTSVAPRWFVTCSQ